MDWTRPVSEANMPPGAQRHDVDFHGAELPIIGRLVAVQRPCVVTGGCGGTTTATLYRCPTSGMNLPGEPSPVAQVRVCSAGCPLETELMPADEQERGWGWDHDDVV